MTRSNVRSAFVFALRIGAIALLGLAYSLLTLASVVAGIARFVMTLHATYVAVPPINPVVTFDHTPLSDDPWADVEATTETVMQSEPFDAATYDSPEIDYVTALTFRRAMQPRKRPANRAGHPSLRKSNYGTIAPDLAAKLFTLKGAPRAKYRHLFA